MERETNRMRDRMRDRRRGRDMRGSSMRDGRDYYGRTIMNRAAAEMPIVYNRDMRRGDRNMERDYGYGNGMDYNMGEYSRRYDATYGREPRYEEYPMESQRNRQYRRYDINFNRYDGNSGEEYLSDDELMQWSKELLMEVDEPYKQFFTKESIEKKARELGIEFKEFTFPELYVATLLAFTDYHNVLGTSNMDTYLHLGKAWLMDPDSDLKYGEKLAAYYDYVVCVE